MDRDQILEIACVVTDKELNVVGEVLEYVYIHTIQ